MFIKVSALITTIIRFVFARAYIFSSTDKKRGGGGGGGGGEISFFFSRGEVFFPLAPFFLYSNVGGRSFGFEVNPPPLTNGRPDHVLIRGKKKMTTTTTKREILVPGQRGVKDNLSDFRSVCAEGFPLPHRPIFQNQLTGLLHVPRF